MSWSMLIRDSNLVRGQYKMGIVKHVIPSDDGHVRRVIVSYKNNVDGVTICGC